MLAFSSRLEPFLPPNEFRLCLWEGVTDESSALGEPSYSEAPALRITFSFMIWKEVLHHRYCSCLDPNTHSL